MALHPQFPTSPYAPLVPEQRWFPADKTLRSTAYGKLLPPLVATIHHTIHLDDTGPVDYRSVVASFARQLLKELRLVFSTNGARDDSPGQRPGVIVPSGPSTESATPFAVDLDAPVALRNAAGSVEDHVHLLIAHPRTASPADLVEAMKTGSSKWLKAKSPQFAGFHWQSGYGVFSISPSHRPALERYIAGQREHHLKTSFQDEYRRLLAKYGIAFDERYVWD